MIGTLCLEHVAVDDGVASGKSHYATALQLASRLE
jgi:hypothetical protein